MDTQLDELEKDAKKFTDSTMQVWGSIVPNEHLEKLTVRLQEEDGKLVSLKTSLKAVPFMMQITKVSKIKELWE